MLPWKIMVLTTVVLEKTLESPLDCNEIKPVNPEGNQSRIFTERTDAEAEAPIFWPPDAKSWLIRKDSDAGKDWRQEEKEMTEDEMVGWYHWLNGSEFEQAPGDGEGQGSQACCNPWGCKESDTTEWLNNKMLALACFFWLTQMNSIQLYSNTDNCEIKYGCQFPFISKVQISMRPNFYLYSSYQKSHTRSIICNWSCFTEKVGVKGSLEEKLDEVLKQYTF